MATNCIGPEDIDHSPGCSGNVQGIVPGVIFGYHSDVEKWPDEPKPAAGEPMSPEKSATLDGHLIMKTGARAFSLEFTEDAGSLTINPADTFFDEPFDPEKTERKTAGDPPDRFVLPANMEELQKLKEKLRAGISRLENRMEYQSDTKGEKPAPMPEGPKRAGILQRIEDMKKQREAAEFRIAELK